MTNTNATGLSEARTEDRQTALAYVQQRSTDLCLLLVSSPAPRGSVQVVTERRVSVGAATVTLAIIGSSHFLEVRAGDGVLCELLSCPRPGLAGLRTVQEQTPPGGWPYSAMVGGINYQFHFLERRLSERHFENACRDLAALGLNRLSYCFPGNGATGQALTCIDWRVEGELIRVTTHHTFPEELTIVQTRSMIDVAEAGALA